MLTRRIIPCLDVASGKVIRGVKFSADRVVGDPVGLAAEYNRQGADELVFYDITASNERPVEINFQRLIGARIELQQRLFPCARDGLCGLRRSHQ